MKNARKTAENLRNIAEFILSTLTTVCKVDLAYCQYPKHCEMGQYFGRRWHRNENIVKNA